MKGLSPIVSTVVLVAAVIVIGSIVAVWASGWMGERQTESEDASCSLKTHLTLSKVTYHKSKGNITMILTNTGQLTLRNFSMEIEYTNGSILFYNVTTPEQNASLSTGHSLYLDRNTSWPNSDINSIKILNEVCKNRPTKTENFNIV